MSAGGGVKATGNDRGVFAAAAAAAACIINLLARLRRDNNIMVLRRLARYADVWSVDVTIGTSFLDTPYVVQTVCVRFGNGRRDQSVCITFANVFHVDP